MNYAPCTPRQRWAAKERVCVPRTLVAALREERFYASRVKLAEGLIDDDAERKNISCLARIGGGLLVFAVLLLRKRKLVMKSPSLGLV